MKGPHATTHAFGVNFIRNTGKSWQNAEEIPIQKNNKTKTITPDYSMGRVIYLILDI